MSLAPIVLFTYDRLDHTKRTIEALKNNKLADQSELIIYSDAAKNQKSQEKVNQLRSYLKSVEGFKSVQVIEQKENIGLAESIITGVSRVVEQYSRVIVLEDDLETSPFFLTYMNEGLERFDNHDRVASIHGYRYPIASDECFFIKGADCWGWATWKNKWELFEPNGQVLLNQIMESKLSHEFDCDGNYPYLKMLKDQIEGNNDSWAVRWRASAFLNNQLTLYYKGSLVKNIGNDNSGTHSSLTNQFDVDLISEYNGIPEIEVEESVKHKKLFGRFYRTVRPSLMKKVKAKLKSMKTK